MQLQEVAARLLLLLPAAQPSLCSLFFFFFASSVTYLSVHLFGSVCQTTKVLLLRKLEVDQTADEKSRRQIKKGLLRMRN